MTHRLYITDHAVVRYLERVLNIDMDKIREDIRDLASNTVPITAPPDKAFMHTGGKAVVIIDECRVVTVLGVKELRKSKSWMGAPVMEAAE